MLSRYLLVFSVPWTPPQIAAFAAMLAISGCGAGRLSAREPRSGESPLPAAEWWVDSSASGGDGSRDHPSRTIPRELTEGVVVHVLAGVYSGPLALPRGATLVGHGEVVLNNDTPESTTVSGKDVTVDGVAIQGGATGVLLAGRSELRRVRVYGAYKRGIDLVAGGHLHFDDVRVECTVPARAGVFVDRADVTWTKGRVSGACEEGLRIEGGRVTLSELEIGATKQAVHSSGGATFVHGSTLLGGTGAALYATGGRVEFMQSAVTGGEYGIMLRETTARLDAVRIINPQLSALAAINSVVEGGAVETRLGSSNDAFHLLNSQTNLRRLAVEDAVADAVLVRHGRFAAAEVVVRRTGNANAREGSALHVRDAIAEVGTVDASAVRGSGLQASQSARVALEVLRCQDCAGGALWIDQSAHVVAGTVLASGETPALAVVMSAGILKVGRAEVSGEIPAFVAECEAHVEVEAKILSGAGGPWPSCVRVERSSRAPVRSSDTHDGGVSGGSSPKGR